MSGGSLSHFLGCHSRRPVVEVIRKAGGRVASQRFSRRIFRRESIRLSIHLAWRGFPSDEKNAKAEGCALAFIEREVKLSSLGVKDMPTKRISRKQSIASRMPVSGVVGIVCMIDDGNGDRPGAGVAGERAPAAACRPDCRAFDAFTREISARCRIRALLRWGIDFGRVPVRVHKDASLFFRRFEPPGYAHAQQSLLVILENGMVESLESNHLIDKSGMIVTRKD